MEEIKRIREAKGISQATLAAELGVDRSAVAKWESAEAAPRADKIPAICRALDCKPNDLFSDKPA